MSKKNKKVVKKKKIDSFPNYPKTKIKVVGVGGGGGSIVSEIGSRLKRATFVVADTDTKLLEKTKRRGIRTLQFGKKVTGGLGSGMNPRLAEKAAEQEKSKISNIFKDQNISIIIGSLGGGVGSGAVPVFSKAADECGNITFGIFTLPFDFEGKKKTKIAEEALEKLKGSFNALIVIPNQKIFEIITDKTSITDALSIINDNLVDSLESLINMIHKPGIINIDFADIRTILKDKNKLAFLNTVQFDGKKGVEKASKKIFNNKLYEYDLKAENILFNVVGGKDLKMSDVEKISEDIAQSNPRAKIIFGISKENNLKNKIKTTVLITGEKPSKKKSSSSEKKKSSKKRPSTKKPQKKKRKIPVEKKTKRRRTALEIKKEEQKKEKEKEAEEKNWEIPAFLRRSKRGS